MLDNPEKRLYELEIICSSFFALLEKRFKLKLELDSKSVASEILEVYNIVLSEVIRKTIKPGNKADIFKVSSGLQLSALYYRLIKGISSFDDQINTLFAYFIGFSFISQFLKTDLLGDKYSQNSILAKINGKHLDFLIRLRIDTPYELPVISNALFWETYTELVYCHTQH